MQDPPAIAIRMADQADIDALCASASAGEAAAIDFDGKLVAVANEYGTVTAAPGLARLADELEKLLYHATEVWPIPASRRYEPSQERGWVLVIHDVDTSILWGVYNHEPRAEDVHFAVIDFYDRCNFELPSPSEPPYFRNEDMPDHTWLEAVQLGQNHEF